ncbi:MAG: hypothetical protein ACRC1I_25620, partial [Pseudomonas proteolytica]|uniref:hypothetical protein n=1 Tax=Pseudomonas proteolytica TaxID=219574 RepID=UPI003F3A9889
NMLQSLDNLCFLAQSPGDSDGKRLSELGSTAIAGKPAPTGIRVSLTDQVGCQGRTHSRRDRSNGYVHNPKNHQRVV